MWLLYDSTACQAVPLRARWQGLRVHRRPEGQSLYGRQLEVGSKSRLHTRVRFSSVSYPAALHQMDPQLVKPSPACKTVYASFGKGMSNKCCSFKPKKAEECVKGVKPQMLC
eukprot:GHUV01012375.1.p1 GENE.GHUV01012375.1~~GHUV01012375.1.p1  ORF type:complete len:112 (+),score=6.96 GHUV01012375.1:175-510(+)